MALYPHPALSVVMEMTHPEGKFFMEMTHPVFRLLTHPDFTQLTHRWGAPRR
jgi:hypothetical protein